MSGRIKDESGLITPVGCIIAFGGTSAPEGWLICDGTSHSTSNYSDLYAVIGYSYGGSGTTFNLPNLKNRCLTGYNSTDADYNTLGNTGGNKTHQLTLRSNAISFSYC